MKAASQSPPRRLLESQWTALLVIAATVAAAMGPALRPGERVWPWNDVLFTALSLDHLQGVLLSAGDWTRGPVAWPLDGSVSQVDWLLGPAALGLPLRVAGVDPLDTYAWVVALGLMLSAWACHAVARSLLGPGPHTWLAALAGALHPLALTHAPYVNLAHSEASFLAPMLLGAGLVRRNVGLALAGGALAGASAHLGFYQGAHAGLCAVVLLACAALGRLGSRRSWAAALAGLVLGVATVVPVASVYGEAARVQEIRPAVAALAGESWDPGRGMSLGRGGVPSAVDPGHGRDDRLVEEDTLLAGPLVLCLALLGLATLHRQRGRRWAWAAVVAATLAAALLALGPEVRWAGRPTGLPAPGRLLLLVPGVENLRAPARWLSVALGGVGLLAALGAREVVAAGASRWPRAAWLGVVPPALWLITGVQTPATEPRSLVEPVAAYDLIDTVQRDGPLVELSARGPGHAGICNLGNRFRAAMFHHRPLVGGLYARRVESLVRLDRAATYWPSDDAVELFRRMGVAAVFEHGPRAEVDPAVARCTVADGHRICELLGESLPMPAVHDVRETRQAPVDGLAWTTEPVPLQRVDYSCDGQTYQLPARPWQTLTSLRRGPSGPLLEVLLPVRCNEAPTVERGTPEYRTVVDGAEAWLPRE